MHYDTGFWNFCWSTDFLCGGCPPLLFACAHQVDVSEIYGGHDAAISMWNDKSQESGISGICIHFQTIIQKATCCQSIHVLHWLDIVHPLLEGDPASSKASETGNWTVLTCAWKEIGLKSINKHDAWEWMLWNLKVMVCCSKSKCCIDEMKKHKWRHLQSCLCEEINGASQGICSCCY